jgi:HEAT repeat protein
VRNYSNGLALAVAMLSASLAGCGSNAAAPVTVNTAITTKAVPEHIKALKDEQADARRHAAHCLWLIGAEAPEATPALLEALHDKDGEVRREAAQALGRTGKQDSKVIGALVEGLKDEDATVRVKAAAALYELREQTIPQRQAILPALIEALKDKDEEVEAWSALLIGKLGTDKTALPNLMAMLKASSAKARMNAADAVAGLGPEAKPAFATLMELAKDDDNMSVRINALLAIGRLGPEAKSAIPFLIENVKSTDPGRQFVAAAALYFIGTDARAAIPALTELLHTNPPDEIRQAASFALDSLNGKRRAPPSGATAGRTAMTEKEMQQMKRRTMKAPPEKP